MARVRKVLVWTDSPTCATGFATVSRNILRQLDVTGKYEFTVIGINHDGTPYDTIKYPYHIHPAVAPLSDDPRYMNPYGPQKFMNFATSGEFDIIFILNDTFLVEKVMPALIDIRSKMKDEKKFSTIYYYPIDGVPKESWIKNSVMKADFPVVYTEFGRRETEKLVGPVKKLQIIGHGVDKAVFYPMQESQLGDFKEKFLGPAKDCYVVLNVNRNQSRKDLHRTMAAFSIFHSKHPNTFLFMLCQVDDVGGNLDEIGFTYGLRNGVDWAAPPKGQFGANQGYPIEVVNKIYNIAGMVVSSTMGEGWGLSSVEAMACKVPVLFPRNTSLIEIIGENEERGYLCKSGESVNFFITAGKFDNNVLRPVVNIEDMSSKMEYIYLNRDEASEKAERAYKEVIEWNQVGDAWIDVFARAEVWVDHLRSGCIPERNDPCPCGSGNKYKHCHGWS